jgi:hypothetical protein
MAGICPVQSNQFPVGALVGRSARRRGSRIRPPLVVGSTDFVFSSVLREPAHTGQLFLSARHELSSSAAAAPAPVPVEREGGRTDTIPGWLVDAVRCPLRTAEQARASLFFQATKSQRWMPWRQEPMKDVSDCEKLRGAVDWGLIRSCPNGETQHSSWSVTPA